MSIYIPARQDGLPTIVIVHGGAWMGGKPSYMLENAHYLNRHTGCACFIPAYTLVKLETFYCFQSCTLASLLILCQLCRHHSVSLPHQLIIGLIVMFIGTIAAQLYGHGCSRCRFPQAIHDICRKMRTRFMGRKIILFGHSAGAHIVTLMITSPRFLSMTERRNIVATIALSGVYSGTLLQEASIMGTTVLSYIFRGYNPHDWPDACIVNHYSEYWPPVFVATSQWDFHLIQQGVEFTRTLQASAIPHTYKHYTNTNHFTIRDNWNGANTCIGRDIVEFIQDSMY